MMTSLHGPIDVFPSYQNQIGNIVFLGFFYFIDMLFLMYFFVAMCFDDHFLYVQPSLYY